MIDEQVEIPQEPKTHSIVTEDCLLRVNHKGVPVTYQGVTGWLIRYVTTCDHSLLKLSLTEARECLFDNRSDHELG